jgi:hypothetical protein
MAIPPLAAAEATAAAPVPLAAALPTASFSSAAESVAGTGGAA